MSAFIEGRNIMTVVEKLSEYKIRKHRRKRPWRTLEGLL